MERDKTKNKKTLGGEAVMPPKTKEKATALLGEEKLLPASATLFVDGGPGHEKGIGREPLITIMPAVL